MTESLLYIFNVISILFLLASVGYLSHICDEQDVNFTKFFGNLFKANWGYFREHSVYVCCYLMMPVALSIGVIQISQLNIGMPRIKTDLAFLAGIAFWILFFLIVKGFHDKTKEK